MTHEELDLFLEEKFAAIEKRLADVEQDNEQLHQNNRVLQLKIGSLVQENLEMKFGFDQELLRLKRRVLALENQMEKAGITPVS
jgi:hypothetical protein